MIRRNCIQGGVYLVCLFLVCSSHAQQGNELLVYAVKGTVTAKYNNQESAVKIGKVLKPGTTINVMQGAGMTMLCKQGKPLSVTKAGSFFLSNWKDSCKTTSNSVTSSYFKYIWSEFYTRSKEYQDEQKDKNVSAVTRSDAPRRYKSNPKKIKIEFSPGLDTLNYASGNFPLSWTCYDYSGKYFFTLYEATTGREVYKDSLHRSFIPVEKFIALLEKGKRYSWTVTAPNASVIRKRILNYVTAESTEELTRGFEASMNIPEDSATKYFRIGYMLEQRHYLAEAFLHYKKAVQANPAIGVYSDKLLRFKSEFWISD